MKSTMIIIYEFIRAKYNLFASKRRKKMFDKGRVREYRYIDEIFCKDEATFNDIVKRYSINTDFWSKQETYTIKKFFPKTFSEIKNSLIDSYFKLFDEKPVLMDIACAGGEWTLMLADKCKVIDGYEYSAKLVESANAEARKKRVTNVSFHQADATEMKIDKVYDGALVLGLFVYIKNDETMLKIIKNIYDHLKPGAYVCTRDTINDINEKNLFMFNRANGYTAVYRSKEEYYRLFAKAGFELCSEFKLNEVNSRRLKFLHIGDIWKKPE